MAAINKPSQSLIPPTDIEEVEEIAASAAEAAIAADDTHAPLVENLVPAENLPSYVDDVLEFADVDAFPEEGETGKIYVALDTNFTYRWSGSTYIQIGGGGHVTETEPHSLEIIAYVENYEVVVDHFSCDDLPDNTWFESTPSSLFVNLQVSTEARANFGNVFQVFLVHKDNLTVLYGDPLTGMIVEYSFQEEQLSIDSELSLGLLDENNNEMTWIGRGTKEFYWHTGVPMPIPAANEETASKTLRHIEPALIARNIIPSMDEIKNGVPFNEHSIADLSTLSENQVYDILYDAFLDGQDPLTQYLPFTIQCGGNDSEFIVNCCGASYIVDANAGPFFADNSDVPFVVEITSETGKDDDTLYYADIYYNIPHHLFAEELNLTYNSNRIWDVSEWLWLINQTVNMQWNVVANSEVVCHDQGQVLAWRNDYAIYVEFDSSNGYVTYAWDVKDPKQCSVDWTYYHLPGSGGSGSGDIPDPAQASAGTVLCVGNNGEENLLIYAPTAQYVYLDTAVVEGFTLQDEGCQKLSDLASHLDIAVLQQLTVIDDAKHKIQNIEVADSLNFDIEIDGINYSFSIEFISDPR